MCEITKMFMHSFKIFKNWQLWSTVSKKIFMEQLRFLVKNVNVLAVYYFLLKSLILTLKANISGVLLCADLLGHC